MSDYSHLWEGRLFWDKKEILTGRIEWLDGGIRRHAVKLHTDPLTQDQISQIGSANLNLRLTFLDDEGNAYGIEEGTIRADGGLREGDRYVFLKCTSEDGWKIGA